MPFNTIDFFKIMGMGVEMSSITKFLANLLNNHYTSFKPSRIVYVTMSNGGLR